METTKHIRVRPDTHKKLRMLAAEYELSLVDTVDKIVKQVIRLKKRSKLLSK